MVVFRPIDDNTAQYFHEIEYIVQKLFGVLCVVRKSIAAVVTVLQSVWFSHECERENN